MKIYNKKYFAYGLASLALGIAVFVTAERPVEIKPIVLALLCAIIGVGFIFRSFSRELTKADKLDELDERNQLIALKSNSKTSQITQLGSGTSLHWCWYGNYRFCYAFALLLEKVISSLSLQ